MNWIRRWYKSPCGGGPRLTLHLKNWGGRNPCLNFRSSFSNSSGRWNNIDHSKNNALYEIIFSLLDGIFNIDSLQQ